MKDLFVYFLTLIILVFQANTQNGKVITVNIHAVSLEGDLITITDTDFVDSNYRSIPHG